MFNQITRWLECEGLGAADLNESQGSRPARQRRAERLIAIDEIGPGLGVDEMGGGNIGQGVRHPQVLLV